MSIEEYLADDSKCCGECTLLSFDDSDDDLFLEDIELTSLLILLSLFTRWSYRSL